MKHDEAISLTKEIIDKIEQIESLEHFSSLDLQQLNSDLYRISSLVQKMDEEFRILNNQVNWSMLERLSFSNIGSGFNKEDLQNLLIENKFGLKQEFETFKNSIQKNQKK